MSPGRRGFRERSARALLVVVSTVVGVLLVEAACQVYVRIFLSRSQLTREGFRATRPLPYQHADYFTEDFLRELADSIWSIPAASGPHVLLKDVAGRYLNVVNGLRRTTNQPPHPERRLLVFGGSTVMSEEVPDQYTIPSYLQRAINVSCRTSVIVLNYGVMSMNARQQRARLVQEGVLPNDIVVFYDGVNDIYYTVYSGGQGFTSRADRLDPLWTALDRAANVSALPVVVLDVRDRAVPKTVTDATTLRRSLDRAAGEYRYELVEAHRFVSAAQGEFIHFLQPHLFDTPLSTPYRREISRNYREIPPGVDIALLLGYPRLREALKKARLDGVESFDLSGLLAAERVSSEVFLDFAHVNHVGNEIVARAIFAGIADRIGDCDAMAGERTLPLMPNGATLQ